MKNILLGFVLAASMSYGQEAPKEQLPEPVTSEKPVPKDEVLETAVIVGAKHDYRCQKGAKKIIYRVSYKDVDGQPPCKVYQLYAGEKTKRIAYSNKTAGVCENALDRLLKKLEHEGMECGEI